MVEIVSRRDELLGLKRDFSVIERITKKIFPDSITQNYGAGSGSSYPVNEYKRFIYTRGINTLPGFKFNEVELTFGLGPNKVSIINERAYDDALQLAQAYENHFLKPFNLYTP